MPAQWSGRLLLAIVGTEAQQFAANCSQSLAQTGLRRVFPKRLEQLLQWLASRSLTCLKRIQHLAICTCKCHANPLSRCMQLKDLPHFYINIACVPAYLSSLELFTPRCNCLHPFAVACSPLASSCGRLESVQPALATGCISLMSLSICNLHKHLSRRVLQYS